MHSLSSYIKSNDQFVDGLLENRLYSTDAERDELVKDPGRVANALVLNFFGMLGLINASAPAQKRTLINFLRKDKKVRLSSIDDTNHDISLVIKLAHEAGFFKTDLTVNQITKFLAKLKLGQVEHIDTKIVLGWMDGLKANFPLSIPDPTLRRAFVDIKNDGGDTIDISYLAVTAKKRVNRLQDGGDFASFAKRFHGLTAIDPKTTTPIAPDTTPTSAPTAVAPSVVSTATLPGGAHTMTTVDPIAPTRKSYYKSVAQRRAEAQAKADAEAQAKVDADAQAKAAEAAAKAAEIELAAKREAENAAAKLAAERKLSQDEFDKIVGLMTSEGIMSTFHPFAPARYQRIYTDATGETGAISPHAQTALDHLVAVRAAFREAVPPFDTDVTIEDKIEVLVDAIRELESMTGLRMSLKSLIERVMENKTGGWNQLRAGLLMVAASLKDEDLVSKIVDWSEGNLSSVADYMIGYLKAGVLNSKTKRGFLFQALHKHNAARMYFAGPRDGAFSRVLHGVNRTYRKPNYSFTVGSQVIDLALEYFTANGIDLSVMVEDSLEHYVTTSNTVSYSTRRGNDIIWLFGDPAETPEGISSNALSILRAAYSKYITENHVRWTDRFMAYFVTQDDYLGNEPYNPNNPNQVAKIVHDRFAEDLVANKWTDSKFAMGSDMSSESYEFPRSIKRLGIDVEQWYKNNPSDPHVLNAYIYTHGLGAVPIERIVELITNNTYSTSTLLTRAMQLQGKTIVGTADENKDLVMKAALMAVKSNPTKYKFTSPKDGTHLINQLPYCNKETVLDWLRHGKETNQGYIMGAALYKGIDKSDKTPYIDTLTGVIQDCIGTDVEEYVNDIMEELPPHVVQRMRSNLVGGSMLAEEISKSPIKPFDNIDSSRLKKIFMYNDLDLTQMLRGIVPKKKKSESYLEFFARAKAQVQAASVLDPLKVVPDTESDPKAINKIMIQRDHAGKHGDVYPRIDTVFDSTLEFPEFEQFRQQYKDTGTVVPAYHGTGGIAAGMILRYGFKVIKSSDPSVTGRMLGDGIYFTNKIDKSLQYVSNGGYSRQVGQKGYIMEMDVNLGKRRVHYEAAGIDGGDSIRSPEWCVRDPKSQLRVTKVYEVTLLPRERLKSVLNESTKPGMMRFAAYLKEQVESDVDNKASFIFRDGMIPIPVGSDSIRYVDFEEALEQGLIGANMIEKTFQGPMVVFDHADEDVVVDHRYAEHMSGLELVTYVSLYNKWKNSSEQR
jgi:hypothetical protein